MKELTIDELLAKAEKPSAEAKRLHAYYRGKIGVTLKCRIRSFDDFAIWYTPGVAAVCKEIHRTGSWRTSTPTSGISSPSSPTARACSAWATSVRKPACP